MSTLIKKIRPVQLALVVLLALIVGLMFLFKWTAKAQVGDGSQGETSFIPGTVGGGDGLLGRYFDNRYLNGAPVMSRVDAELNFTWVAWEERGDLADNRDEFERKLKASKGISKAEEFSVSWTGELQAQYSEPYTFYMESDDGVRVWLDEELVMDDWVAGRSHNLSTTVNLRAGQKYLLRIEYFQEFRSAFTKFSWSSPSTPKQIVPRSQLYSQPTDLNQNGLPDIWEAHHSGTGFLDPRADSDGDGLSNLEEYLRHSNPMSPVTGGLPDEWSGGPIRSLGSAYYTNGMFVLNSQSYEIWWGKDSCYYVFKPLKGDGQIVARLLQTDGGTNNRAGVMIRQTLDAMSANAVVLVNRTNGVDFQWRLLSDRSTERVSGATNAAAPYWVKIVRWGDWLGGYSSTDGLNWTLIDWTAKEGLPKNLFVGLVLAGNERQRPPTTAYFDQVSVGPIDAVKGPSPVVGTGTGLLGSYFGNENLSGVPFTNRVDPQVDFNWKQSSPFRQLYLDRFSMIWSGEVEAQFTEPYTFSLETETDDGVRAWLNEQLIIDQWNARTSLVASASPLNLKAGQHYLLRIEYRENEGAAAVKLRWASPSTSRRLVPQSQLYSPPKDTDGDGMPDIWETLYQLNPNDPSDALQDADGDGISNLQEYLSHSNPRTLDSDGDGIPDAWELANGLNPMVNDAQADGDGDGLNNLAEFRAGTDPNKADTDGDGLSDGMEVNLLGTNPRQNSSTLLEEVCVVSGAQGRVVLGDWKVDGTDLCAEDRRGELEYILTTTKPDKFLLKLIGSQNRPRSLEAGLNLLISIDGESFGHRFLKTTFGVDGLVECLTPYLPAGAHTMRVIWDDAASQNSLRLKEIKMVSVAGLDGDGNGIKDWVDKALQAESGRDTNAPLTSFVSPICLEGRDPYLSMMSVTVDSSVTNQRPVRHNAGSRWYANVPLSAQTNTDVILSFQNSGRVEKLNLQWLPINLLSWSNMVIRAGDSLRLTAQLPTGANGDLIVTIGTNQLTGKAARGVKYQFSDAGVFTVAGTYTSPNGSVSKNGSITVTVLDHNFGSNPDCWVNYQRYWNVPNLVAPMVLEADPRLLFEAVGGLAGGGKRVQLVIDDNEPRYIVSRLGKGGPILDSAPAKGFRLWSGSRAYTQVVQAYEDGSQLVEMLLVLSPVLPNVTVRLETIVAGVTFEDGTTVKILTAQDFDELGRCALRFIRPAKTKTAICHEIKVFQGTTLLGHRR